jgi:hypothetical protein
LALEDVLIFTLLSMVPGMGHRGNSVRTVFVPMGLKPSFLYFSVQSTQWSQEYMSIKEPLFQKKKNTGDFGSKIQVAFSYSEQVKNF